MRAAKPTALKLIAGERRRSRINLDEPVAREGTPQCPSDDPEVRAVWDYALNELQVMRTVTMADRDTLHAYCEAVVLHRLASEAIRNDGLLMKTPNGGIRHPAHPVLVTASATMRQFAREFGFTPSARSGIKVGRQEDKPQDASRLLSG